MNTRSNISWKVSFGIVAAAQGVTSKDPMLRLPSPSIGDQQETYEVDARSVRG